MNFYEFEKILEEAKKRRIVPNPNRHPLTGLLTDPCPIKMVTWNKPMPKGLKEKLSKSFSGKKK